MSIMSNLVLDIQEDLEAGRLSFAEIAAKHEVPMDWVELIQEEYVENDPDYLDSDCHLSQVE